MAAIQGVELPTVEEYDRIEHQVMEARDAVEKLAQDVGYVFYLEPGPAPGTSMAYWGPEIRVGVPQPALTTGMDALSNVEGLSFTFDREQKSIPVVYFQDEFSKSSIGIPIPDVTPLNPPLGLIPPQGLGVGRRALVLALVSWGPIAVWAALAHRVFGGVADEPLLAHFGIHVRCLVAIPLLVIADATVHAASRRFLPYFVTSGLVGEAERPRFEAILRDVQRLSRRWLPWVLMLGLVVGWTLLRPAAAQRREVLHGVQPAAIVLACILVQARLDDVMLRLVRPLAQKEKRDREQRQRGADENEGVPEGQPETEPRGRFKLPGKHSRCRARCG